MPMTAEAKREYARRWRAAHPEYKEKQREYMRQWKAAHPEYKEKKRDYARKIYHEDPEKARAKKRDYHRKNGSFLYPRRAWTLDEDLMVIEHSMTDAELGKLLQRSMKSVSRRRERLNTMFRMHMV